MQLLKKNFYVVWFLFTYEIYRFIYNLILMFFRGHEVSLKTAFNSQWPRLKSAKNIFNSRKLSPLFI